MSEKDFNFENSPELTTERKLEIALAYIKDTALLEGKKTPHFNSPKTMENIRRTIECKYMSEAGVTEEEAMKFISELGIE